MKVIAFDLGNVVFDFDYTIALEKIKDRINASVDEVIEELFVRNFTLTFEKGIISRHDFYRKFKERFSARLSYEEFVDIWCDIFFPNKHIVDLVKSLRLIYPLYLISNINELHYEYLHKKNPEIFALFDDLVLSYRVKSLKPEKEIYEELRRVTNQAYEDIIYIDDRADLIEEARRFNLQCLKFVNYEQCMHDLISLGVAVPTEEETAVLTVLKEKITSSKNPLVVGVGNTLRADDGIGVNIIETVGKEIRLPTLNVGYAVENYLSKLTNTNDLIFFIDCAYLSDDSRFNPQKIAYNRMQNALTAFKLYSADEIKDNHLYFTHNASLRMLIQYLQSQNSSDILILAVKTKGPSLGEDLSEEARRAELLLTNFFLRNFNLKR